MASPVKGKRTMQHDLKPKYYPIGEVVVDWSRNVREMTADAYDVNPLINDMAIRGQQDPVTLELDGGKLYPLKGFRRCEAMKQAATRGLKFETSAPDGGKPMDRILAIVYKDLNPRERTELLLDHGQRKGLNKVELQNAAERAFNATYSDKEIVTLLYGLLDSLYPANRKVDEDKNTGEKLVGDKLAQARFEYYKGVLQTMKRIWKAPSVMRNECFKKLRGEQNWPTNTEIIDLVSIFDKEVELNPMHSKEKPGPKFTEKWDAIVKTKKEADLNGTRSKSASMRNRQQVEESIKNLNSPISKFFMLVQLGDIGAERLVEMDKILGGVWDKLTDDERGLIVGWFPKPATEAPAI